MALASLRRGRNRTTHFEWRALPIVIGPNDAKEFWTHVVKADGCWLWTGPTDHKGYGRFKGYIASRFSFALNYYDPATDTHVCHTCDNPPCVRPDHIVIGSPLENSHDMVNKGRNRHGPSILEYFERQQSAVESILDLGRQGMGLFDIAKELRVHVGLVRRVRETYTTAEGGTARYGLKKTRMKGYFNR
jgi:hypothetical protein